MAFLVAGTLQAASQLADAQDSLRRKVPGGAPGLAHSRHPAEPQPGPALALPPQGKYSLQGSRVALTLSSHGMSTATVAALDCAFRSLGFESCVKRETSAQVSLIPHPTPSTHPTRASCTQPGRGSCPSVSLRSWFGSGSSWMPTRDLWAVPL